MKRLFSIIMLFILLPVSQTAGAEIFSDHGQGTSLSSVECHESDTVRILAIGNSFSEDAVEQYLCELFKAGGHVAIIGNMYIGGCPIDRHMHNAETDAPDYAYRKVVDCVKAETMNVTLAEALTDEDWDYVSVQQASGRSGIYSSYALLPDLIKYVRTVASPDVRILFHQTWAYQQNSDHGEFPNYGCDQMSMYRAIMEAVQNAVRDNPEITAVIPSGTAVQNARTSWLGDNMCRDGYHLNRDYGRYTAACTWYESISGKSAPDNPYRPASVSVEQARVARMAAHLAVEKPYEVTDMSDFH